MRSYSCLRQCDWWPVCAHGCGAAGCSRGYVGLRRYPFAALLLSVLQIQERMLCDPTPTHNEEELELGNRAEISKIHDRPEELEVLKSDVEEIKAILKANARGSPSDSKMTIVLVITKVDLLLRDTDMNCIGDWVVEATVKKKLNVLSIHLTSSKSLVGITRVISKIQQEKKEFVVKVVSLAMACDGTSEGVVRTVTISALLSHANHRALHCLCSFC